ncbi:MAG: hypothetical protein U1F87_14990 [Kiritimatiellia bacterium]
MSRTPWIAAGLALLAGLLAFGRVVTSFQTAKRGLDARTTTLRALQNLALSAGGGKAARAAFDALPGGPAAHETLAQTYLPGRVAAIKRLEPADIDAGWRLERVEVTLTAVPWSEIATWLAKASNERPPWRLAAFSLTAAGEGAGSGVFTFESPVRK